MNIRRQIPLLLILLCLRLQGEDVRYIRLNPVAYDLGVLVPKDEFSVTRIRGRLQAFGLSQASRHQLSRLTIGLRETDLRSALPSEGLPYENPGIYNGQWDRDNDVAQVLCLDGMASGYIKVGDSIHKFQISGTSDPRDLSIDGRYARLVSFKISNGPGLDQISAHDESTVYFFIQARPGFSVADARQIWDRLASLTRTYDIFVYIRTDSIFVYHEGPKFDVFQTPFPNVPEATYRASPFIICGPQARRSEHPRHSSCTMSSIAKEPHNPIPMM